MKTIRNSTPKIEMYYQWFAIIKYCFKLHYMVTRIPIIQCNYQMF